MAYNAPYPQQPRNYTSPLQDLLYGRGGPISQDDLKPPLTDWKSFLNPNRQKAFRSFLDPIRRIFNEHQNPPNPIDNISPSDLSPSHPLILGTFPDRASQIRFDRRNNPVVIAREENARRRLEDPKAGVRPGSPGSAADYAAAERSGLFGKEHPGIPSSAAPRTSAAPRNTIDLGPIEDFLPAQADAQKTNDPYDDFYEYPPPESEAAIAEENSQEFDNKLAASQRRRSGGRFKFGDIDPVFSTPITPEEKLEGAKHQGEAEAAEQELNSRYDTPDPFLEGGPFLKEMTVPQSEEDMMLSPDIREELRYSDSPQGLAMDNLMDDLRDQADLSKRNAPDIRGEEPWKNSPIYQNLSPEEQQKWDQRERRNQESRQEYNFSQGQYDVNRLKKGELSEEELAANRNISGSEGYLSGLKGASGDPDLAILLEEGRKKKALEDYGQTPWGQGILDKFGPDGRGRVPVPLPRGAPMPDGSNRQVVGSFPNPKYFPGSDLPPFLYYSSGGPPVTQEGVSDSYSADQAEHGKSRTEDGYLVQRDILEGLKSDDPETKKLAQARYAKIKRDQDRRRENRAMQIEQFGMLKRDFETLQRTNRGLNKGRISDEDKRNRMKSLTGAALMRRDIRLDQAGHELTMDENGKIVVNRGSRSSGDYSDEATPTPVTPIGTSPLTTGPGGEFTPSAIDEADNRQLILSSDANHMRALGIAGITAADKDPVKIAKTLVSSGKMEELQNATGQEAQKSLKQVEAAIVEHVKNEWFQIPLGKTSRSSTVDGSFLEGLGQTAGNLGMGPYSESGRMAVPENMKTHLNKLTVPSGPLAVLSAGEIHDWVVGYLAIAKQIMKDEDQAAEVTERLNRKSGMERLLDMRKSLTPRNIKRRLWQ